MRYKNKISQDEIWEYSNFLDIYHLADCSLINEENIKYLYIFFRNRTMLSETQSNIASLHNFLFSIHYEVLLRFSNVNY